MCADPTPTKPHWIKARDGLKTEAPFVPKVVKGAVLDATKYRSEMCKSVVHGTPCPYISKGKCCNFYHSIEEQRIELHYDTVRCFHCVQIPSHLYLALLIPSVRMTRRRSARS